MTMATKKILGLDLGVDSTIRQVLKAVPLAVSIAMSPLKAPAQNTSAQSSSATKTEQVAQPKEKVLQALRIENPSLLYDYCILELVSTDGDDNFSEKVSLTFHAEDYHVIDFCTTININKIDELKKIAEYKNGYAVEGKGNYTFIICDHEGDYSLSNPQPKVIYEEKRDVESMCVAITKEFYDFLYANFKDVFPNKVDLQTEMPSGHYQLF